MWSVASRSQSLLASTRTLKGARSRIIPAASVTTIVDPSGQARALSSRSGKNKNFSPRRRPSSNYRPTKARGSRYAKKANAGFQLGSDEKLELFGNKRVELGDEETPATGSESDRYDPDGLSRKFGPQLARGFRYFRKQQDVHKGRRETAEDLLRDMDYLTSAEGSTEALAWERRALSEEFETDEERERFMKDLDNMVEEQRIKDLDLEAYEDPFSKDIKTGPVDIDYNDTMNSVNPNQLAFGEWGELLIRVDRNIKLWRGGRIQSYRALVIGGNLNGCAGFGTGKAMSPREAVMAASRHCKRNIFFVDRYQTNSLTRDLVGKSNSCKVLLRATNRGLRGNPLCAEILKYFGITNCSAKAVHGNRSQYNVVRATFKALMTHQSMEEIAHKRGRRIVSIDRGRRLQMY